jgi:hypothetical protein
MHPLLRLLRITTQALPEFASQQQIQNRFLELTFQNRPLGWIPNHLIEHMNRSTDLANKFHYSSPRKVEFLPRNQEEINKFIQKCYEKKMFSGWRGEEYEARALDGEREKLFLVERAFARVFGLVSLVLKAAEEMSQIVVELAVVVESSWTKS